MNWYKYACSSKMQIPENFDAVECSKKGIFPWRLFAGSNDWETGVTTMAVIFQKNDADHLRIWIKVNNNQFPKKNNNDQSEDILEKVSEWGKKAIKTLISEFKKIEKNVDVLDHHPKESFLEAIKSKEMKPFVEEWGVDVLDWKPKKDKS